MKGSMSTDLGIITVNPEVIAKYAGSVAVECFGITVSSQRHIPGLQAAFQGLDPSVFRSLPLQCKQGRH